MAMWQQMGIVAKAVAFVLFFMSMWSFGVAIERIFTFTQARNQSKMFAPQVADYFLREIAGESIIINRDNDQSIRAFYNVCRHRGTRIVTDAAGKFSGRIQC